MKEDYRITYITSTNKMIVMKPEAEIDYELHARSPKKFYERVFEQEVDKIKVRETGEGYHNPDGSPRRKKKGEMSPVRITAEHGTRSNMVEFSGGEKEKKATEKKRKQDKETEQ